MQFRIDPSSATPVYAQIVNQIKRAIAAGVLQNGDSLPSLRDMATQNRVHPLTVSRAYKQLEHEGYVKTRHGLGTCIHLGPAPVSERLKEAIFLEELDLLLVEAHNLGITDGEIKRLIIERIDAEDGQRN
jgi:GntR family transcriptional regulator